MVWDLVLEKELICLFSISCTCSAWNSISSNLCFELLLHIAMKISVQVIVIWLNCPSRFLMFERCYLACMVPLPCLSIITIMWFLLLWFGGMTKHLAELAHLIFLTKGWGLGPVQKTCSWEKRISETARRSLSAASWSLGGNWSNPQNRGGFLLEPTWPKYRRHLEQWLNYLLLLDMLGIFDTSS